MQNSSVARTSHLPEHVSGSQLVIKAKKSICLENGQSIFFTMQGFVLKVPSLNSCLKLSLFHSVF